MLGKLVAIGDLLIVAVPDSVTTFDGCTVTIAHGEGLNVIVLDVDIETVGVGVPGNEVAIGLLLIDTDTDFVAGLDDGIPE